MICHHLTHTPKPYLMSGLDLRKYHSFWNFMLYIYSPFNFNPLNAELNHICHLLALLRAHRIFQVSGLRVNTYLILYIYGLFKFNIDFFSSINITRYTRLTIGTSFRFHKTHAVL